MRKNPNEINELDQRSRVLRALGIASPILSPAPESIQVDAVDMGAFSDDEPAPPPEDDEEPPSTAMIPSPIGAIIAPPADVVARYLDACASRNTRGTMAAGLNRAARLMGLADAHQVPWSKLRSEHTDAIHAALMRELQDRRYRMPTVRTTLVAVKGVLRQARRMGLMSAEDYFAAIEWNKLPEHRRLPVGRELPEEEITKILTYCNEVGGAYGAFIKASVALLLGTGLRASEACQLPVSAYDPTTRWVRFIRKGGREEGQPLGNREVAAIDAWLVHRKRFEKRVATPALLLRVHTNDWVRPSSPTCTRKVLRELYITVSAAAGVPVFRPHDLRRTLATKHFRKGTEKRMIQRLMGHVSGDTTDLYDMRGEEELATARRQVDILTID